MTIQRIDADQWFSLVESQVNKKTPERLELILGLRARFGHLLRESIVSVMLEFDGQHYVISVAALGEALFSQVITHHLPNHLLNKDDPFEWQSLLPVAEHWIHALDEIQVAQDSRLFTEQALAFIDRMNRQANSWDELETSLENAKNAFTLQSWMAESLAASIAPAIRDKIEASVRNEYQSNPANGVADADCRTEWHELGAIFFNGDHMLLQTGIDQLNSSIYSALSALTESDKLALWFYYSESIYECLDGRTPEEGFNVLHDTDTFDPLLESIASNLQSQMQDDWEKMQVELVSASN